MVLAAKIWKGLYRDLNLLSSEKYGLEWRIPPEILERACAWSASEMQPSLLLAGCFYGSWEEDGVEEDGLDSNWRGGCLFSGAGPQAARGTRLRGEEHCCVNARFLSARLAVNGAGLMGLVRGRRLMSVVHAARRGAAIPNYQEVWRWQRKMVKCGCVQR